MENPKFTTLSVTPQVKELFKRFAERRRMHIAAVGEVAIKALDIISRDELDALIENRTPPTRTPARRKRESAAA